MKRLIATYALLMVLSMIVVSCEHKELCYSHPHSAKVSVEFEWSQMPEAYSPGGMRVIFYPRNGGEEIVRDFVGKRGGCVEIPSGVYDVVCFNNDTQRVKYNVADGFSSIAATTGVAQVGDVKAFRTPDYLCGGRMVAVEVEVKIGCEQIIVLPVAPMVCRYTYTVRGVKNLQNFSECVAVQQAMCSEYSVGGDNEIQESKADICFAMERNGNVDIVLCKTQARFARDMELVEKYVHNLFHEWNVRFITVVDRIDNARKETKKTSQILGLTDQWYLEDTSLNIRETLKSKRKDGQLTSSFATYGYMKDPENKNHHYKHQQLPSLVLQHNPLTLFLDS